MEAATTTRGALLPRPHSCAQRPVARCKMSLQSVLGVRGAAVPALAARVCYAMPRFALARPRAPSYYSPATAPPAGYWCWAGRRQDPAAALISRAAIRHSQPLAAVRDRGQWFSLRTCSKPYCALDALKTSAILPLSDALSLRTHLRFSTLTFVSLLPLLFVVSLRPPPRREANRPFFLVGTYRKLVLSTPPGTHTPKPNTSEKLFASPAVSHCACPRSPRVQVYLHTLTLAVSRHPNRHSFHTARRADSCQPIA
jgi:hypothetical protein